jgi:hypothetical protein
MNIKRVERFVCGEREFDTLEKAVDHAEEQVYAFVKSIMPPAKFTHNDCFIMTTRLLARRHDLAELLSFELPSED